MCPTGPATAICSSQWAGPQRSDPRGRRGVRRFFVPCYAAGVSLIAGTLALRDSWMGAGMLLTATVASALIWRVLTRLRGAPSDYAPVMRLKYVTSGLFVAFIAACLAFTHFLQPADFVR
ncbi:MAG TPA: hypothetical protein VGV13_13195 [Methylomirabilota bacterium]|nr:hypothetical protein [Methylomirabilota bacterium]